MNPKTDDYINTKLDEITNILLNVDVENINIFDFSMDADTKLKLYMKGFVAGVQK